MIEVNIIQSEIVNTINVPNDMGLNLMEILKGENYETIEGTCGGMALCATCHVKVISSIPSLSGPDDEELDMLETLPLLFENSRLGCQIKLNEDIKTLTIEILKN